MTSGVRDSLVLLQLDGIEPLSRASRAQALAEVFQQRDTKFKPGTAYDYTNGGYLLLSEVVERVSGEKFETYVGSHGRYPNDVLISGFDILFFWDARMMMQGMIATSIIRRCRSAIR